jgi:hypothetical protein
MPTIWYETEAKEAGEGLVEKEIPGSEDGTEQPRKAYFTTDSEATNRKTPGAILYEDYRLADSYSIWSGTTEETIEQEPLVPVFTRAHYTSTNTDWEDAKGTAADPTDTNYDVTGDTQLHQKWTSKKFTVKFDSNDKGAAPDSLSNVDEALSAKGGLAEALAGTGKSMPVLNDFIEPLGDDASITYKFVNWADRRVGGKVINASTSLFPEDENTGSGEVTLFAQGKLDGESHDAFNGEGKVQTWTVPKTGIYKIEVWGAGGNGGGLGGYISGDIALTAGKTLYIYVGKQGAAAENGKINSGGWNGGGNSGGSDIPGTNGGNGGGGGHGATDVRTKKASGADTVWNDETSLKSRIIMAGGGGGESYAGGGVTFTQGNGGLGKAAGGAGKSSDGNNAAGGSTESGTPGAGGNGKRGGSRSRGGGGGGGGYYGGTGGNGGAYPGGGGSSWAETNADDIRDGLYFISDTIMPETGVPGGGSYVGNGKAEITFVSEVSAD